MHWEKYTFDPEPVGLARKTPLTQEHSKPERLSRIPILTLFMHKYAIHCIYNYISAHKKPILIYMYMCIIYMYIHVHVPLTKLDSGTYSVCRYMYMYTQRFVLTNYT